MPASDHGFCDGARHCRPEERHRVSTRHRGVFLADERGREAMAVTDEIRAGLVAAMKQAVGSAKSVGDLERRFRPGGGKVGSRRRTGCPEPPRRVEKKPAAVRKPAGSTRMAAAGRTTGAGRRRGGADDASTKTEMPCHRELAFPLEYHPVGFAKNASTFSLNLGWDAADRCSSRCARNDRTQPGHRSPNRWNRRDP